MRWLRVVGLALGTTLVVGCGEPSGAADPELLTGRLWSERKPANAKDRVHQLMVLKRPARGLFSRSSAYELHLELFGYEREGNKLRLVFPQSDRKADLTYDIQHCDVEDFDLCLTLSKNPWPGPKKYYGVEKKSDADESVSAVRERLERELEHAPGP